MADLKGDGWESKSGGDKIMENLVTMIFCSKVVTAHPEMLRGLQITSNGVPTKPTGPTPDIAVTPQFKRTSANSIVVERVSVFADEESAKSFDAAMTDPAVGDCVLTSVTPAAKQMGAQPSVKPWHPVTNGDAVNGYETEYVKDAASPPSREAFAMVRVGRGLVILLSTGVGPPTADDAAMLQAAVAKLQKALA